MKEESFVVYKLSFPNGKVYIGLTSNFKRRMSAHKSCARRGVELPVYFAIRKYGWKNIEKEIIGNNLSRYIVDNIEMLYIAIYNSSGKLGYNVESGGCNNKNLSSYTCKKISVKSSGVNNSMSGRRHSKVTLSGMSACASGTRNSMSGKKHSLESRAKISESLKANKFKKYKAYLYGNFLGTFDTLKECSDFIGLTSKSISYAIKNGRELYGKYWFESFKV